MSGRRRAFEDEQRRRRRRECALASMKMKLRGN
jgi:hypothetical protein